MGAAMIRQKNIKIFVIGLMGVILVAFLNAGSVIMDALTSKACKMDKTIVIVPEIKLVGITARTNSTAEMNPAMATIGLTMQKFFAENISENIGNKKSPGKILAVYTNYESDFTGDYTYFLGQEVTSFDNVDEGCETITIPAQTYVKFTSDPGKMSDVVIQMWQQIWTMSSTALGGERAYIADFEVYDERSYDPNNAIVDVYIGIKK